MRVRDLARVALILVIVVALLSWTVPAYADAVGEVLKNLSCRCGCGMVLDTCRSAMEECAIARQMGATTSRLLAQGRTTDEITAYFIDRYGEVVLAAPTKRGFNVVAWTMPFIAILAGLVLIYVAIKLWIRKPEYVESKLKTIKRRAEYEKKLADELEDFE